MTRTVLIAGLALGLGATGGAQYAPQMVQQPGLSYTEENPPITARLAVPRIQGQALDHIGMDVPEVVLGLYSDPEPHKLLARTMTDTDGHFDFGKKIRPGNYRLIAMYPGTCTANIPLEVNPHAKHKKLQLQMEYPGVGICSYALLK